MRIEKNQKDTIQSHRFQTEPSLSKAIKATKEENLESVFFFYSEVKIREQKTIFLERCWATELAQRLVILAVVLIIYEHQ